MCGKGICTVIQILLDELATQLFLRWNRILPRWCLWNWFVRLLLPAPWALLGRETDYTRLVLPEELCSQFNKVHYRPRSREIMHLVVSIRLSICRAHERGYSDTRHCQNFSSDTRHWGQKMLDTRHSKFTPTLNTQLQKDVIDCAVWKID